MKLGHPEKEFKIIVPNHGSKEIGSGLAKNILRKAGIK